MAKIMLAVNSETFHNLPIEEQDAIQRHALKFENMGGGIVAFVIDSEIVSTLNVDWGALQMGALRKIVTDIKREKTPRPDPHGHFHSAWCIRRDSGGTDSE